MRRREIISPGAVAAPSAVNPRKPCASSAISSPLPHYLLMSGLDRIYAVADPRNFFDFVQRRSCQLCGPRQDPPVALTISIPEKEARSGIVEPIVRIAGPTICLRAFLEAVTQPRQSFCSSAERLGLRTRAILGNCDPEPGISASN